MLVVDDLVLGADMEEADHMECTTRDTFVEVVFSRLIKTGGWARIVREAIVVSMG